MTQIDTGPLREYVVSAIAYIIETRESMKRPPMMALKTNIRNVLAKSLDGVLDEMVKEGLLTAHPTVNDTGYEFTPPKQSLLKHK